MILASGWYRGNDSSKNWSNARLKRRRSESGSSSNKKQKIAVTPKVSRKRRLEDLYVSERPSKKPMLQLEEDLAKLNVEEKDPEKKTNSLALVEVKPQPLPTKILDISDITHGLNQVSLSAQSNLSMALPPPGPKLDPALVSKKVLQTLCSLGCVQKVTCWDHDFYLVKKEKLIPVFPKPTSYYFKHPNKKMAPPKYFHMPKETPVNTQTLVGLWLLLVQMGYFVPFSQVGDYVRMFSPEVNYERVRELGRKWLKQLGVDESIIKANASLMDLLLQRLATSLTEKRAERLEFSDSFMTLDEIQELN